MEEPRHALAAPSHADPYGWYAQLRAERPLFFDASLGLWVASGRDLVEEALRHAALRVRPPREPVPRSLQGRPAGEVFSLLLRMNDGEFHACHRPEVERAATRWSDHEVAQAAEAAVRDLLPRTDPNALLGAIPVQAMARLLGVAPDALDATVGWVHDFVAGIAPTAQADAIARADDAAQALMAQGEAERLPRVNAANRIALMQQSLDATAGLIGNAIVRAQAAGMPDADALVAAVARSDPAIHNTRRFAAAALVLAGQPIAADDALLLILAPFSFGAGPHACPGERIALQLAAAALRTLQSLGAIKSFGRLQGYRPLPNARIPIFAA